MYHCSGEYLSLQRFIQQKITTFQKGDSYGYHRPIQDISGMYQCNYGQPQLKVLYSSH